LPAGKDPCQSPETSCARALVPSIIAIIAEQKISLFIERPPKATD
jgi:hypothetical protein